MKNHPLALIQEDEFILHRLPLVPACCVVDPRDNDGG